MIYLVYGAPCSGRSKYIKDHAGSGDVVLDPDRLVYAMAADRVTDVVRKQADQLFDLAIKALDLMDVQGINIWISEELPKRRERQQLIRRLKAKAIFIDSTLESCLARAKDDPTRSRVLLWFESFEPDRTDRTNWNAKAHKFYTSAAWKKKRAEVLEMDHHECQICKARGRYSRATIVHHVNHLEDRENLALEVWNGSERNLISVCAECHNELHPEKGTQSLQKNFLNEEKW